MTTATMTLESRTADAIIMDAIEVYREGMHYGGAGLYGLQSIWVRLTSREKASVNKRLTALQVKGAGMGRFTNFVTACSVGNFVCGFSV